MGSSRRRCRDGEGRESEARAAVVEPRRPAPLPPLPAGVSPVTALTPRAVVALQRAAGNRAVSGLLAGRGTRVQRDVGFEYETTADTYVAAAALIRRERGSWGIPAGSSRLTKGDTLIGGIGGFHAKADDGGIGLGSNLELQTDPFPETAQGRAGLNQALKNLERFCVLLDDLAPTTPQVRSRDLGRALSGRVPDPLRYLRAPQQIRGNPQATAAIRLDKMAELMERTVGGPTGGPQALPPHASATRLELGGDDPASFPRVGDAPRQVRAGATAYDAVHGGPPLPVGFPSPELVGLCALLLTYILTGEAGAQKYPKEIAPLMSRTQFGSIFTTDLPEPERTVLAAASGAEFLALWGHILTAAGVVTGVGAQVFSQEPVDLANQGLNISGSLTRQAWLLGISQGNDLLTAEHFPALAARPHMEGLGGYGNLHGVVNPTGNAVNAPIVELRRMQKHLDPHDFTEMAMGVYDYVVALNSSPGWVPAPDYARTHRPVKVPKRLREVAYVISTLL